MLFDESDIEAQVKSISFAASPCYRSCQLFVGIQVPCTPRAFGTWSLRFDNYWKIFLESYTEYADSSHNGVFVFLVFGLLCGESVIGENTKAKCNRDFVAARFQNLILVYHTRDTQNAKQINIFLHQINHPLPF